jgi:TonB family protein
LNSMDKPFPPRIIRPPALHAPEAPRVPGKPSAARLHGTGGGLLGSLAIHIFLVAAAWSVTLIPPAPAGGNDENRSAAPAGFEMNVMSVAPSDGQTGAPPQFASVPPHPTLALTDDSEIRLPHTDLPALLTSQPVQPMARATTETTGKSDTKAGRPSGNNSPGTRSGHGGIAGRTQPPPPPKLLHAPPPRYPSAAKAAKISGKVAVLIRVHADGSPASAAIFRSCGNRQLDQAAVDAAKSWTFSPTPSLTANTTIPVIVHVTFSL